MTNNQDNNNLKDKDVSNEEAVNLGKEVLSGPDSQVNIKAAIYQSLDKLLATDGAFKAKYEKLTDKIIVDMLMQHISENYKDERSEDSEEFLKAASKR